MVNQNEVIWNLFYQLQQLEVPLFCSQQRGLTDVEINQYLQGFSHQLPADVRMLYKWCNLYDQADHPDPWLFPVGYLLPLQQALDLYNMYVGISVDEENYAGIDHAVYTGQWNNSYFIQPSLQDPPVWDRRWLPIFGDAAGGDYIVVCDAIEQPLAPIYFRTSDLGEFYFAYDSLTSMLLTMIEIWEAHAYHRDKKGVVRLDRAKASSIYNRHNPHRRAWFFHVTQANSLAEIVLNLDHADEDTRYYAYLALQYMFEPEFVPLLLQQLDNSNIEMRIRVVNLLSILDDQQAVMPLIPLLDDSEPTVQLAAVNALIDLQDKRAVTPLFAMLQHQNDKIRERVIYGLGEFRVQSAIPTLLTILAIDKPMARSEAARTLGKLGDYQVVPALINALQDDHPQVRHSALWALSELGGENPQAIDEDL